MCVAMRRSSYLSVMKRPALVICVLTVFSCWFAGGGGAAGVLGVGEEQLPHGAEQGEWSHFSCCLLLTFILSSSCSVFCLCPLHVLLSVNTDCPVFKPCSVSSGFSVSALCIQTHKGFRRLQQTNRCFTNQ